LDVGCGGGSDAKILIEKYELKVYGIDIYEHREIKNIESLEFKQASIFRIPYEDNYFDYVFLHDVLHHIDEPKQRYRKHVQGLKEVRRVCKKNGVVIILEANRYNPLSYPHMVLVKRHNHFKNSYLRKLIYDVFKGEVEFKNFEAHFYPKSFFKIFKIYERIMEKFSFLRRFLSYNIVIAKNDK
jgi:ubiquinone/menaquinone biosynthesis C-methylase UbiE